MSANHDLIRSEIRDMVGSYSRIYELLIGLESGYSIYRPVSGNTATGLYYICLSNHLFSV